MGDLISPCLCPPQAFTVIDQNRDGIIDKEDLRDTFAAMGELPPLPVKIQGCRVLGVQQLWVPVLPGHLGTQSIPDKIGWDIKIKMDGMI